MSRALADYDIAHRFVASYIFELPFGRGRRFGSAWNPSADCDRRELAVQRVYDVSVGDAAYDLRHNVAGNFQFQGPGQQQRHEREDQWRYP